MTIEATDFQKNGKISRITVLDIMNPKKGYTVKELSITLSKKEGRKITVQNTRQKLIRELNKKTVERKFVDDIQYWIKINDK